MNATAPSPVALTRTPGDAVWLLQLNRPKANIIDATMTAALHEIFMMARKETALRAVVLQAVVVDPSQPSGYDFSNAVEIEFLP